MRVAYMESKYTMPFFNIRPTCDKVRKKSYAMCSFLILIWPPVL